MSNYLSKRGYVIRKDSISKEELVYLKTTLQARPLQNEKYNNFIKQDTSYCIYTETKNKIYIPKMFGIEKFGFPESCLDNYNGKSWETDNIIFNGSLYENQIEPANKLIKSCHENGGGILQLGTGFGKTITLLYVLSQLKGKTIVVVNKIPLMKQWQSEIEKFLPNAKVGIIQGHKNIDVEGKDIVVAMLQSLTKIDYPDTLFQDFSTTVIDEIHNTSSQMFSKIFFKLCSKYTIGLSATPTRADGCEYVFKWHIGDIVYKSTVERNGLPPILKLIRIDSSEYKEISTINRFTGQKQIQFTSMLSELTTMQKRNRLILELVKDLVQNENRKILVLSDRREHLKSLKVELDKDNYVNFTYGLFLGQMKQTDLQLSRASQVIFATFSAFGEGVSEKDLDTLILVTPKKFIGHLKNSVKNESGKLEQIVGRIFRKDHIEKNPLIIDLQDNFSVYKNQSTQRRTFYKTHFTNITIIQSEINLDNFDITNIKVDCLKTTKTISNNTHISENPTSSKLLEHCVIEE